MGIELHCPQCQKLIRAPDNAGGRRGKCPYCKNSVYIPMPPDESEEIGIAPIDEGAEQRAQRLREESIQFTANVDHASEKIEEVDAEGITADGERPPPPGEVLDPGAEVEAYVRAMHASKLDDAEAAVARLRRSGPRGRDHVQGLLVDEMPGAFGDVPPPLVQAFLKKLLGELG